MTHIIDCDAVPYIPDSWKIEEHRKSGQLIFAPSQLRLYLDADQKDGWRIDGYNLRKRLANQPVLNACVLDFLLANPDLISEDWKTNGQDDSVRYIFFWGTVFRDRRNSPCIRCLFWNNTRWEWGSHSPNDSEWCDEHFALMSAY